MERGNTKHGPIRDEFLEREARAAERPEDDGLDRGDWEGDGTRTGGAPAGMTPDEVEERSRLGRYIPRAKLPGRRDDLLVGAVELNAPDDVLETLKRLPAGETFHTVSEAWEALGHTNEDSRRRP